MCRFDFGKVSVFGDCAAERDLRGDLRELVFEGAFDSVGPFASAVWLAASEHPQDSVGRAPRLLGRRCACRAPEWIRRELHAYALPNGAYRDLGEKRLVESLHAVYPETRAAKVVRSPGCLHGLHLRPTWSARWRLRPGACHRRRRHPVRGRPRVKCGLTGAALPLVIFACVGAWLVLARACSHPALRSLTLAGNVPDLTEGND